MAPQLKGGSYGLLLPSVILTGPFQPEVFYDSVISYLPAIAFMQQGTISSSLNLELYTVLG